MLVQVCITSFGILSGDMHLYVYTYIHVRGPSACAYLRIPLSMKPCITGSQCAVKYVRMCYKVLYITNFQLECNAAYLVEHIEH